MDQDDDDKTPRKTLRKKAREEERKEEGIARSPLERRKSDTPSKDKKDVALELAKVKRERDFYKKGCEDKERQIQEYYGILAQCETQLEAKTEEFLDKDREIHELKENLTEMDGKWRAEMTIQLQNKDIEIQRITEEADYYKRQLKKTQNDAAILKESLETYEKERVDTKIAVDELGGELSKKVVEVEDLNDVLAAKEQEIINLKEETGKKSHLAQEERKQVMSQLRKQVDELVKKTNSKDEQIKELVENLQVKEAENAVYKQDFETERSDRQRIHAQYEELKTKVEERSVQHKADQEAMANLGEQLKETKQMETDRIKVMEEEIQVLTAQVNAYSRECEKQKGLVAQNQERHKTEIQVLNEKLTNEQKSKQQLESQLAILRQQFDSLTASRENLLTAYNQENAMVTSLEQQLQRMREESEKIMEESAKIKEESVRMKAANKVLMEKVRGNKESANSPPMHPSTNKSMAVRRNDGASTNNYQVSPQATFSGAAGENHEYVVQGEGTRPSNRMHSDDLLHILPPQMTAEDMARLFKNPQQQQQQPAHYKPSVDISEQQRIEDRERQTEDEVSKSEQETDKVLQELERARQKAPLRPPPSSGSPPRHEAKVKVEETEKPVISKLPSEPTMNNLQAADDDSGSDLKGQLTKEIHEMAEEVRRKSKRPETDEVLFDDEDSSLPYDPNLVCPKCGRQYRVGEIQKLKRHMVEFCTGKR